MIIPITQYSPDMPQFQNPGTDDIRNCIPVTDKSYGPFPQLIDFGGALTSTCLGAYSCIDALGNVYTFAGDINDLYNYTAVSTNPNTISNGTHPYSVGDDDNWFFTLFGQRVCAANGTDPIQSFLLNTSTRFGDLANGGITALTFVAGSGYTPGTYALSVTGPGSGSGFAGTVTVNGAGHISATSLTAPGKLYPQTATISIPAGAGAGTGGSITPTIATIAPICHFIADVKGFLMGARTTDAVSGDQPQRVWWSADNDPTNWPTPGTATAAEFQSSYNDLFGEGGWIMGIVGNLGTADGAVFMEHAIWRVYYAGPPNVFDFIPAEGVRGTPAPGSIAQLGGLVYYLGEDGFYSFDGTTSTPIGFEKVDKTFYADLDLTNISRIRGAIDPVNRLYLVAYPGQGNSNGNPNHILAYHWPTQKWSIIDTDCEVIFRSLTFGNNVLDTVGAVSLDTESYNAFPMDSRVWQGNVLTLAGFDTNHELAYFNGPTQGALLFTTEMQPFEGRLGFIQDCRPLVDGGTPSVAFGYRNRLVDDVQLTTPVAMNAIGTCPQTVNGRYLRAQITIPIGDQWTHCQGVEVFAVDNGVM